MYEGDSGTQSTRGGSLPVGNASSGARQNGVTASLQVQRKVMEEIHSTLSSLEQRLEPVMGPGGPEPSPPDKNRSPPSPLASFIGENNEMLIGMARRLAIVHQRLDL